MTAVSRFLMSCAIAILLGGQHTQAQSAVTQTEAIDPQPLVQALSDFAKRTGLQLIYVSDIAHGVQSKGARAGLSAEETLRELLRDTGLAYEFLNDRTVAIRLTTLPSGAARTHLENPLPGGANGGVLTLAQAQPSGTNSAPAVGPQNEDDNAVASQELPAPEETDKGIPELLVKGSRIINADIQRTEDDSQPYVVFDRESIAGSGAVTVEGFLKGRLTMNTVAQTISQQTNIGAIAGGQSQINLRGLGSNQTLILVDGRRTAGVNSLGAQAQPDLNGIPLAAIERIEVLPTTASGIYGGGATGGVVNVILRRDYDGVEAGLAYGDTLEADASTQRFEFSVGLPLENGRTSILAAATYLDREGLIEFDRALQARGVETIRGNNPAFFSSAAPPPLGATPNIRSTTGANLVLRDGTALNSPVTFVPPGYVGTASDAGAALRANAGSYNFGLAPSAQAGGGERGVVVAERNKAAMITIRRQFTDDISAFLDAGRSDKTGRTPVDLQPGTFVVNASASNNPFQQAITVRTPVVRVFDSESSNDDRRLAGGAIFRLPGQWMLGADHTWSRQEWSFRNAPTHVTSTELITAVGTGSIDILRDPALYTSDFAPFVVESQETLVPFKSTMNDSALRASGPLLQLPAGAVTLSALLEYRKVDLDDAVVLQTPFTLSLPSRSQSVRSAYLELRAPLVSELPAARELELQLAGRHDEYETNGVTGFTFAPTDPVVRVTNKTRSTDPTIGLRYLPIDDLALRASYGTGFLPPSVAQLAPSPPRTLPAGVFLDPRRGNAPTDDIQFVDGGNPNLQPEDSRSWSAGAIFQPTFVPGLRLSADYTRIEKRENVLSLGGQAIINDEAFFPGRVVRGPVPVGDPFGVGPILSVDATAVNVAETDVEAYDVALDYGVATAGGTFDVFALATWQTHLTTRAKPSAPSVENAGVTFANPLKLKANAGLRWSLRGWHLGWTARHFDSYRVSTNPAVIQNQGGDTVPSQTYHDVFATYRFSGIPASEGRLLQGTEVSLEVTNVFKKRPPFDASNNLNFFFSPFGDPMLGTYLLSVKHRF